MTVSPADLSLFEPLAWRLARLQSGAMQGRHAAQRRAGGDIFSDVAGFLQNPDPRRLDLRRTLTDPFGTLQVRRFQHRVRIELHILLDASASLSAGAASDRQGLAALVAGGMARAAVAGGDTAVLHIGAGERLLQSGPGLRNATSAQGIIDEIAMLRPSGRGLAGLTAACDALPQRNVFVVLISDFEAGVPEIAPLLSRLQPRPMLPVWLRDSGLEDPGEGFGLMEGHDPETGARRLLLRTNARAARFRAEAASRHAALRSLFASHGITPLEVCDSLEPEALTEALAGAFE
ncbi:DUF58 domain-containing protein [Falsigemmobacter intermedius]|uniref:DUF58 domain-containing protein n=1 Tax=Falsigemmobacter intermedius TaxID=1553448 RepID=UPI003F11181D